MVCYECEGWGVCLECEGSARDPRRTWGRCECVASNAGPGRCGVCLAAGQLPAEAVASVRRRHGTSAEPGPGTVEGEASSPVRALAAAARLTCACGEFRALWRAALSTGRDRPVLTFSACCQGCAAHRAHDFALPG
ncbi:hypothetical protein GCM10022221_65500 [Actinocorallia aurea]